MNCWSKVQMCTSPLGVDVNLQSTETHTHSCEALIERHIQSFVSRLTVQSNLMPIAFVWCFARILKSCKLNFPLAQITTSGIVGLPLRVFWTWNKLQYLFRHQLNDVEQMHRRMVKQVQSICLQVHHSPPYATELNCIGKVNFGTYYVWSCAMI